MKILCYALAATLILCAASPAQPVAASKADLARAQQLLGVQRAEVQELAVPDAATEARIALNLEGTAYELELYPYSLRAPDFTLVLADGNGDHIVPDGEIPAPDTYRGRVVLDATGQDAGSAYATLHEGQMWAVMNIHDHPSGADRWAVQPLAELLPGRAQTSHVIHRSLDALPQDGRCGNSGSAAPGPGAGVPRTRELGDKIIDLAVESDSFYTATNGNLWKATVRDIEKVLNTVEAIYETNNGAATGSPDITYHVTYFVVRFAAGEVYTTNDPSTLVGQMASHWLGTKGQARRDLAHLFTGRDMNGSTIGWAYFNGICSTSIGYGVSQSKFFSNLTNRAGLTAHEFGHNWSAQHCDGLSQCRIMCSNIGGCTGDVTSFGPDAMTSILNFKASRSCLDDDVDKLTFPIFDDFEAGAPDPAIWNYLDDVVVDTTATAEPSGIYSAKLTAPLGGGSRFRQGEMRTGEWAGACCNSGQLSFYLQHKSMEAGEETDVFVFVKGNYFKRITSIVSDGIDDPVFTFYSFPLDSTMVHPRARLKIVHDSAGGDANDFAYLDDVMITASTTLVFSPHPPPQAVPRWADRSGRVVPLRAVGVEPGRRVVFFASLGGAAQRPAGAWVPLGEAVASSNHVATTHVPLPGDIPAMRVTFHAFTEDEAGRLTAVEPLESSLGGVR